MKSKFVIILFLFWKVSASFSQQTISTNKIEIQKNSPVKIQPTTTFSNSATGCVQQQGMTVTLNSAVTTSGCTQVTAQSEVDMNQGFDASLGSSIDAKIDPTLSIPLQSFQVMTLAECREGGDKHHFVPFGAPGTEADYSYNIVNLKTAPTITITGFNTVVINNNKPNDAIPGAISCTISRAGYVPFTVQYLSENTCDHDNLPLNCPENTRLISMSNNFPKVGEVITVTYLGTLLPGQTLNNFGNNYTVTQRVSQTVFQLYFTALPGKIQLQPSQLNGECHGWSVAEVR